MTEWKPPEAVIERFTWGDCAYLARAIHKLTGWPTMAFETGYDTYGDIHAFVQMPDGRLLDIYGPLETKPFIERWSKFGGVKIAEHPWDDLMHWGEPDFDADEDGLTTEDLAELYAMELIDHFRLWELPFNAARFRA